MSVSVHSGSGEVGKRPSDGEVRRGEGTDRAGKHDIRTALSAFDFKTCYIKF